MTSPNIGYGIIGTPKGLQMELRGLLAGQRVGGDVDLPNRIIKIIEPKDEILAIVRQKIGDDLITYFILYRYAKEMETDRTGTFYGSVVALRNCKAPGAILYALLVEMAASLSTYTKQQDGRFLMNLDKIVVKEPYNLSFLSEAISSFSSNNLFEKDKACFIPAPSSVFARPAFFDSAFNEDKLTSYERIFLSESTAVANYVREQNGMHRYILQPPKDGTVLQYLLDGEGGKDAAMHLNLAADNLSKDKIDRLTKEIDGLKRKKDILERENNNLKEENEKLQHQAKQADITLGKDIDPTKQDNSETDGLAEMDNNGTSSLDSNHGDSHGRFFDILIRFLSSVRRYKILGITIIAVAFLTHIFTVNDGSLYKEVITRVKAYVSENGQNQTDPNAEKIQENTEPDPTNLSVSSELSSTQQNYWKKVDSYLLAIEKDLNYDKNKMVEHKREMEKLKMEDTKEFERFENIYNNYRGSGQSFDSLQKINVKPSNITKLELIATDTLTVTRLASFLIENCSTLSDIYTQENMEQVIINSNPNDIEHDSKIIPTHNSSIILYIPKSVTCNFN